MGNDNSGINTHYSSSIPSKILKKIGCVGFNVGTCIYNLVIHRDSKVVLLGAWGGAKFADNPRFLYQYLFSNKEKLGLKKVIWVTRNRELNDFLNNVGYESYLCGTKESRYYHLRAGLHFICNSDGYNFLLPDIDTKYSWGAKKIQLWHGVGMKTVGSASNSYKAKKSLNWKRTHPHLFGLFQYGGWNNAFYLCTSKRNAKINYLTSLSPKNKMFISAYPRNCKCMRLLPEEQNIINSIRKYRGAIVYLPTFRDEHADYTHPLDYSSIPDLLQKNEWVWVEKPHTAESNRSHFKQHSCATIELDSNFDVNVLYDYVNGLVSDYSSAAFDGFYRRMPTILFTPDLESFKNGSGGLYPDFEDYCGSFISRDEKSLYEDLNEVINGTYLTENRKTAIHKIRKDFFDDRDSSYEEIWNDILNVTGLKKS